MSAPWDEGRLRAALAPHATNAWPMDKLLVLCREWRDGTPTADLTAKVGATKNAAIGKIHRLLESEALAGYLAWRDNPCRPGAAERAQARPKSPPRGARTLPPLPSERADLQP